MILLLKNAAVTIPYLFWFDADVQEFIDEILLEEDNHCGAW